MKILIMTGPLYPMPGNNANLIGKLIPYFLTVGHEVHLCATAFGVNPCLLPRECFDIPIHWITDNRRDWKRKLLYPTISKIVDPNGLSDAMQVQIILREMKEISEKFSFEAVLSTSEPYVMACAVSQMCVDRKVLYIMDPPASVSNGKETVYRNRMLPSILKGQTALITTPFILEALNARKFLLPKKTEAVGFPMITPNTATRTQVSDAIIRLLFCGWLYSDIRSPKYFLDIVSRLDEHYEVTFMGKECELLQERFPTKTRAKLITIPNQPYEVALQAMADTDVLINIGNSVPVHIPSKTLEYINTGKPILNFYKFLECPTLYYMKQYPLALNIFEEDKDMGAATARLVQFCENNAGKTVDRIYIENAYADCMPKFIAKKILELLEN